MTQTTRLKHPNDRTTSGPVRCPLWIIGNEAAESIIGCSLYMTNQLMSFREFKKRGSTEEQVDSASFKTWFVAKGFGNANRARMVKDLTTALEAQIDKNIKDSYTVGSQMKVKRGMRVTVFGSAWSGKLSFLCCIFGEIPKFSREGHAIRANMDINDCKVSGWVPDFMEEEEGEDDSDEEIVDADSEKK
ncbi:hypothetical protein Tco_0853545 [Tanacetum coccineum]